jgi:hypothetical protein
MARMRTWPITLAAVQIACGGTSTPPPPAPSENLQSTHFRFEYPAADSTRDRYGI